MICIKILTDLDFKLVPKSLNNPRHHYGARGIVFNADNKVAVLYKQFKNEYKLIGGCIEANEDLVSTF